MWNIIGKCGNVSADWGAQCAWWYSLFCSWYAVLIRDWRNQDASNSPLNCQTSQIHIQLLSAQGTEQPSAQPTGHPSAQPTGQPTSQPTGRPTSQPKGQPSAQPTGQPSAKPSSQPVPSSSAAPTTSGAIISTRKPSPGLLSTASRVAVDPVSEGPPPVSYPLGKFPTTSVILGMPPDWFDCFYYLSESSELWISYLNSFLHPFCRFWRACLLSHSTRAVCWNKFSSLLRLFFKAIQRDIHRIDTADNAWLSTISFTARCTVCASISVLCIQ